MYRLFTAKQQVRTALARLWPLGALAILALFLLQPQTGLEKRVHTSSFGRAVFGFVNGDKLPGLGDSLYVVATIVLWLLILLLIVRVALGLLAGDKRLISKLSRWLQSRPEVTDEVHHTALPKLINFFGQDPQPTYVLRYTTTSLSAIEQSARISLIDEGYVREGWRPRISQRTTFDFKVPVLLPHVYIIAKAGRPDQTSIVRRLRDIRQLFRLEGDFSDVFDVYAAYQFETHALTILQPDVMHQLMKACPHIDIELSEYQVRLSQPGFAASPSHLEAFEREIEACYRILRPYLTKQHQLAHSKKLSHEYELRNPTIRPLRLVFDPLLRLVVGAYFVLLLVILISSLLPISETTNVAHELLKVNSPWFDTLEALAYLFLALTAIVFIASEVETTLRRLVWQWQYHHANQVTKRARTLHHKY